ATVGSHLSASLGVANLLAGLSSSLPTVFEHKRTIAGRAKALSGDTLEIDGTVIRLAGLAAPKTGQICRTRRGRAWRCGARARQRLRRVTGRAVIICRVTGSDPATGKCRRGQRDLGAQLIGRGLAFADTGSRYAEQEALAKQAQRGVWQGEAEHPQDYADRIWASAKSRAPDGCPIKGEIRRGQKLYVMPWAREYSRARVTTRRGERWFCSEDAALAAGWRPIELS
ncbi:MAG: thermonuclease family protein, partial [Pseudomonadota bacterium]